MYKVIAEDRESGVFEYLVNDIRLKIDYPFYMQDKNDDSFSLNYLKVSATDKKHLVKLYNVNGTNLLLFKMAELEIYPSDLSDAAEAFLSMKQVIDCFQEIVSRNFPFDFTREQDI